MRDPDTDTLKILADLYGVSVDYLLGRDKKESEYTLSESKIDYIIKETEKEYGVNLRDDPVVENMVREVLRSLAKMKKRD
ncbi:hypothetical protein PACILC2_00940 [Paenibacillus cisolokensis]|uniref:HTH cro/C1-type domain-containing protein n=1 Tax=Paenibacillus cisolokensis TaxID=1658519 RepID=A0ABQ4N029_9BACL|nr:hypothetical protein PACILC2_00940 [Paenibacillus cisolokensis]